MRPRPPQSTLFPYTTLFRSARRQAGPRARGVDHRRGPAVDRLSVDAPPVAEGPRLHRPGARAPDPGRSEEHTSELQSRQYLVCRLLLEKKKESSFSIPSAIL